MTSTLAYNKTENKLTAAEIESSCPVKLQDLGKRIVAHYEKAVKSEQKAEEHYTAIAQYLAQAKQQCDEDGFDAFREKYCPDLGRSRVYELLAIGDGKTSVEDTRTGGKKRAAKHRAKKATQSAAHNGQSDEEAAGNGVRYVTDKSGSASTTQQALDSEDAAANVTVADPSLGPVKSPHVGTPPDEGLMMFTRIVTHLLQCLGTHKASRFKATAVKPDDLAKLGEFLTKLAKIKKSSGAPAVHADGDGNAADRDDYGSVSPDKSVEEMKAKHAAADEMAA